MPATDVEIVFSLAKKGFDLHIASHFERALDKWRAALAAAEALGADDCIMVAMIKTHIALELFALENAPFAPLTQDFVLSIVKTFGESVAILRRRRDAGTLLQDKCRRNEVLLYRELMKGGMPTASSAAEARHWERELDGVASLVGYDAFLEITATCLRLMLTALQGSTFEPGSESEHSCLSFLCDLCDDAVSLIILPRVPNCGTPMESAVFMRLPGFPSALQAGPVHQEWRNRILSAYARLSQSAVADARGLNGQPAADALTTAIMRKARSDQARSAAAAAGKLRSCALVSCGVTEAHVSHFKACGACKTVAYCCKEHQVADWPAHKAACKAARKPAASKDAV
jgi:hypothetical protein